MNRTFSLAVVLAAVSGPAFADAPIALPTDVPPVIGSAMLDAESPDDLTLKMEAPKVAWEVVGKRDPKREWPRFKVSVTKATLRLGLSYPLATQLAEHAQNRVLNLAGKRLNEKQIRDRLSKRTPVLISVSGKAPDPYYLQCARRDTLIVVLGLPSFPAPELLAQPAAATAR